MKHKYYIKVLLNQLKKSRIKHDNKNTATSYKKYFNERQIHGAICNH